MYLEHSCDVAGAKDRDDEVDAAARRTRTAPVLEYDGLFSLIYLLYYLESIKRNHYVRREGLEIPTLI